MTLRMRIWLLPLVSAGLFAVGIAFAVWLANGTSQVVKSLGDTRFPNLDLTTQLFHGVDKLAALYQSAAFEADLERLEQATEKRAELQQLTAGIAALEGLADTGRHLDELLSDYAGHSTRAVQIMADDGSAADPAPIIDLMQTSKETLDVALVTARADALSDFEASQHRVELGVSRSLQVLVTSALIICAVLGIISWVVIGSIWRQLGCEPRYAQTAMNSIARGDLSVPINLRAGDTTSLLAALLEMRNGLNRIVGEVRSGTDSMSGVSTQLAAGNDDLSSRTEAQSLELTRTSGNMLELTTTVEKNADSAREANKLAGSAAEIASQGGKAVSEIINTMDDIRESSNRIATIIGLIDNIAFQTNILALNAAVESARAGEHGRGFAVVASEVRTLAHSSSTAASDIGSLIKASVDQAEAASDRVTRAGETIGEAVLAVGRVTTIVEDIAHASASQAEQIREMADAVKRMDSGTQRNAEVVEQAAAAANSMQEQARLLSNLVASFTLKDQADTR